MIRRTARDSVALAPNELPPLGRAERALLWIFVGGGLLGSCGALAGALWAAVAALRVQ